MCGCVVLPTKLRTVAVSVSGGNVNRAFLQTRHEVEVEVTLRLKVTQPVSSPLSDLGPHITSCLKVVF
jgi:hypothetical protein